MREAHEVVWREGTTPAIYTISNITTPEFVTERKLQNYSKLDSNGNIKEIRWSDDMEHPLFVRDKLPERGDNTVEITANTAEISSSKKASAFYVGLEIADVDHGSESGGLLGYSNTKTPRGTVPNGWARYKYNPLPSKLSVSTLQLLKSLYDEGNKEKAHRISADRACRLIHETVAAEDWYEQVVVTESKIKAFFAMSPRNQQRAIDEHISATSTVNEVIQQVEEGGNDTNALGEGEILSATEIMLQGEEMCYQEIVHTESTAEALDSADFEETSSQQ